MENERRIMRGTSALLSRKGFDTERLLAPQQAIIAFLSRGALLPPKSEPIALELSAGRVLAHDVASDRDFPSALRSTMDGFAIRSCDLPGTLRVIGEVEMGKRSDLTIAAHETMRIPTGGLLPSGADAVVPFEQVELQGGAVRIAHSVTTGDCLTKIGEDFKAGERILCTGRRIAAPEIGVLATLGQARVSVFARPRIAVLSSGDELVALGTAADAAQTTDSNRYVIAAALRAMGADVRHYPTVPDVAGALEKALRTALPENDAIVLSGGSSVGERDRTPWAIDAIGEPGVIVHGLRVKPGKPTVLAAIKGKPILGLPGNPTSALMILEAVGAPIVAALSGWVSRARLLEAVLAETIESRAGWTWYVPVSLCDREARYQAQPLPIRSSLVSLCARADGFVAVDESAERLERGTLVRVQPFSKGWS